MHLPIGQYTSWLLHHCGAMAGIWSGPMDPPWGINPMIHNMEHEVAQWIHHEGSIWWSTAWNMKWPNGSTMRDQSDDPSHGTWSGPMDPPWGINLMIHRMEHEVAQWIHHEGSIWWSTAWNMKWPIGSTMRDQSDDTLDGTWNGPLDPPSHHEQMPYHGVRKRESLI